MDILFIRHGETDWNREMRIQGGIVSIDINARGIRQAEISRDGLVASGYRFDRAFVSPYHRARHTAEILLAPHGIEPTVDDRLHEINFGPYEGTSIRAFADDNIRAAFKDPPRYTPQRGGESFESVEVRLREFLEQVIKPLEGQAQTILVVAHGGILRTLTRLFDIRPLSEFWTADHQPNCCAHLLSCRNGILTLERRGLLFYDESLLV